MPHTQRCALQPARTALAAALFGLVALPAAATNGMNLEAYGARAAGMGGASFALENGNSAVMNNPATLGLRKEGHNIGIGLTLLMPDVETRSGPMSAASDGDRYWMPSLSYIRKSGPYTFGVALLAQGGMGTEYGSQSFLSGDTGLPMRSEVGMGRLMFPLAYNVNERLTVAAQIDYVWASMDLQMLMPDGSGHASFSNNNDFTGAATGDGWAFKLGVHYQVTDTVAIGATYHSKTNIGDLEGGGTFTMLPSGMQMPTQFKVVDFQWPETYGVGVAWQATPALILAADIKHLGWSDSMRDFRVGMNMGQGWMVGSTPQNWKDQTIIMIGAQYMLRPGLALRAGINHASNPVPDGTLNPLFPAIIETHYTLGFGWNIGGGHTVAGALAISPKETRTNPHMFGPGMAGTVSHRQTTLRLNYTYSF